MVPEIDMGDLSSPCPECGSADVYKDRSSGGLVCLDCLHRWGADPSEPSSDLRPTNSEQRVRIFLSYGRIDAQELAERLEADLSVLGFDVWRDKNWISSGREWDDQVEAGLRSSQLVVAILTPHAVREQSVCRDEISFARFACKLPIVPVQAAPCEPPFVIFRLDWIDLCSWRDSADQYRSGFRRLVGAIGAALRGEPAPHRPWDDRFRPFDFASFLHDRRRDFCGRQWVFDAIEAWRSDPTRARALLITGNPGIGKSAIVAQLVHLNPGGQVLAYHCCRADTPETLRPARFVRSVTAMIASQLDEYARLLDDGPAASALAEASCERDAASAFEEGTLAPLHRIHTPPGGIRYILIDALDEALTVRERLSLVDLLSPSRLERLPAWLRVVATTRKEPDILDDLRGLRAEEILAHDPRNLDDVERFLALRLAQPLLERKLLLAGLAAQEANRRLRASSDGNFLWVQQALLGIERGDLAFDRLDALPPGLTGLYRSFFERQFPDEASYEVARTVLEAGVAAREPLSFEQLAVASGIDPHYELPRVLGRLAAYLPERDGRYGFYHKSMVDWLTAPMSFKTVRRSFAASPRRGHERLAESCWAEYEHGMGKMSPYALAHLPAHLTGAGRWDDLAALLFDLPYLEARAEAGQVFELAGDFARAAQRLPVNHPAVRNLRLIDQALRSDLNFLSNHPETLFQCLWNRCWWYDSPEAAAHYEPPGGGWTAERPPWSRPVDERLSTLLEAWQVAHAQSHPGRFWVRSLRPPEQPLGGAQIACFRGHTGPVFAVACSPDGRHIVSGSGDATVRVWDADRGADVACFRGHRGRVRAVAYSRDGRSIVSGSGDATVRVWDADSGDQLACLRGHEGEVNGVVYSPDGSRIFTASEDATIRVWDADSGAEVACFRGHGRPVNALAISADGRRIASASRDNSVRIWDAECGVELTRVWAGEPQLGSVAFSPDGRRFVYASEDEGLQIRDTESVDRVTALSPRACLHATSVSFAPDGRRILSGSESGDLYIGDAQNGGKLACTPGHDDEVHCVSWLSDGRRYITGAADATVRMWDGELVVHHQRLRDHEGPVGCKYYSPDGKWLVTGSSGLSTRLWDRDSSLRIWNADNGVEHACLRGHLHQASSIAFSPDSRRLVSMEHPADVRVWDVDRGVELLRRNGHSAFMLRVCYSRDGRRLVVEYINGVVEWWDPVSGKVEGWSQQGYEVPEVEKQGDRPIWRAASRRGETVIEPVGGGEPVAWYPADLYLIAHHPCGRAWAGSVRKHLHMFQLEPAPDPVIK
jgi:WD40 repeat protein